jgi:hypothetical protein
MCIVTIRLPVQSQDNERSCLLLPLHYLYKARTMSGHVYCYHCTTCIKPVQSAVMSTCVLLPLQYQCKARTMSGHVYCYHYTTCKKSAKWAVMCIVTITLPVQTQENERSCVLLPLHYNTHYRSLSWLCTGSLMEQYTWRFTVLTLYIYCNGNNIHGRLFTWLCTGSVMVTIHMSAHLPGFVQVV